MRTYVLDIDGEPAMAFRAMDSVGAQDFIATMRRFWGDHPGIFTPEGKKLTIRPATVPEQERWRRASIESEEDAEDEDDPIMLERLRKISIDGLVVPLGTDEEE